MDHVNRFEFTRIQIAGIAVYSGAHTHNAHSSGTGRKECNFDRGRYSGLSLVPASESTADSSSSEDISNSLVSRFGLLVGVEEKSSALSREH